jgi:hypothetical protein
VDELHALAIVLAVPPIALLVDPKSQATPLATKASARTGFALLWLTSRTPWTPTEEGRWSDATLPVRLAQRFEDACVMADDLLETLTDPERQDDGAEGALMSYLLAIQSTAEKMHRAGMAFPEIPAPLVEEARHRGIWRLETEG